MSGSCFYSKCFENEQRLNKVMYMVCGFASLQISQTSFCMNWLRALDLWARSGSSLRVFLKYDYNRFFTKQNIKTNRRCSILAKRGNKFPIYARN